jgi:wyosine [tRNA(Phe)-imidazoG37] synthetase (radical SAM superfamily)
VGFLFFLMSKYIYGPVKSRRLGLSLGVSLSPSKICNFNCIYCQLGGPARTTGEGSGYAPPDEIIAELKAWLEQNRQEAANLDFITLSGLGEPSLHPKIGELILRIKELFPKPVAIITNSSRLSDPVCRRQLLSADLIVPSLDAASDEVLEKINRPAGGIKIQEIIQGLIALRKEFKGKIWLEVMLVKGINDGLRHIRKLKEAIGAINPDKVQLNSPVRTTTEPGVFTVRGQRLEEIREILGDNCEVV